MNAVARPEWEKKCRFEDGTWYEDAGKVLGHIDDALCRCIDDPMDSNLEQLRELMRVWKENALPQNRRSAEEVYLSAERFITADAADDLDMYKALDSLVDACTAALAGLRASFSLP